MHTAIFLQRANLRQVHFNIVSLLNQSVIHFGH
jgi:hypothetical protein